MSRHSVTTRVLQCDVLAAGSQCPNVFTAVGKLDWFVVQARARERGWKQSGDRHRCPAHRHTQFDGQPAPRLGVDPDSMDAQLAAFAVDRRRKR